MILDEIHFVKKRDEESNAKTRLESEVIQLAPMNGGKE